MGDSIRFKRGTTPQRLAYTPAIGEPVVDTDTDTVFIGDGSRAGGHKVGGAGDTVDFTLYVATAALGGTAVGTGRQRESGTTTVTLATKLVNGNAAFTSALVGKTVYNTTDGTWAKITAVDSTTQLSLSSDIMTVSKSYVICDAVTTLTEAYALPDSPYRANITIRFSPGTFAGDATLIGKTAGENRAITVQGDNTAAAGGTTLSGNITIYDKVTFAGGANYNLTFTGKLYTRGGADVTWNYCATSGTSKIYKHDNSLNRFTNSTATFGNDPGTYTAISSTITKGYTMYAASATYGGSDAIGDGLQMYSGTATSTLAGKLVDSVANFGTDVVGKTVYNSTDNTWAKVFSRDSATQLSLVGVDIMVSGEAYVISNAFATVQKVVDAIPGTVNCNTTIQISNESYAEAVNVWGKNFSGSFSITVQGSRSFTVSGTATSGANPAGNGSAGYGTLTDTTKAWVVDSGQNMWVEITGGAGAGQIRVIHSNTATVLTIVGRWDTVPDVTSTYRIFNLATTVNGTGLTHCFKVDNGQKGINLQYLKLMNAGNDNLQGGVMIFNGSSCNINWCHIENCNYWGVQTTAGATGSMTGCVCRLQVIGDLGVYYGSSFSAVKQCRFTGWKNRSIDCSAASTLLNLYQTYIGGGTGAGSIGIYAAFGGGIYSDAYLEVNGSPSHNISCQDNGIFFLNGLYGARSTQVNKNAGGWGVISSTGGIGSYVSGFTYSGNVSGTYTPTTATVGGNT